MEVQKGSISEKNVFEILAECHRLNSSGKLAIKRKQVEKSILLRNGSILRADSSIENEKLGQFLIKKNLVSPWDLEVALTQLGGNGSDRRIGQILIGMSALKEPALEGALVTQAKEIIFSVVDWEDGEYNLQEVPDIENESLLGQLYTPEVLLQAARRISNAALLLRSVGDQQAKLRLAPDYLERIRKLTLITEEKSILALLHKPSSIKDLMSNSSMEKTTIYRSVAALLAVGVVLQGDAPSQQRKEATASGLGKFKPGSLETSAPSASKSTRKRLGDMLVEQKVITQEQLDDALKAQSAVKGKKQLLGTVLVQLGHVTEEAMIECLSTHLNIKKVDEIEVTADVLKLIPIHLAKKYFVCPMRRHGSSLEVAMVDPTNMAALDDLSFVTGYRIRPFITTNNALKEAWESSYNQKEEKAVEKFDVQQEGTKRDITFRDFTKDDLEDDIGTFASEEGPDAFHFDVGELENLVSGVVEDLQVIDTENPVASDKQISVDDAPIVKLVNTIMRQAIQMSASDIHIEPWENKLAVRFRLDGLLHKVMSFPPTITSALISRIKIISQMDIAERRRPQDGRIKLRMGKKRTVDYRISTVPTIYGERVVMRVLDRATLQLDLAKLGFDPIQLGSFKKAIEQPYGMILCTGPTGSGKTTTLYSALASLDHMTNNIITVEDPVEYNFPGISQVQINEAVHVTFAEVLRTFLRQDPDIILVGEIRDSETSEICAKAALTGHLVFSTVHTNDAPSAIGRLIDLGLKPYLVSASLLMVIAQRLLRKVCMQCKTETSVDKKVLIDAGFSEEEAETTQLYVGSGCDSCARTGFFGRTAIYEIMPVTRKIKSAIAADLPSDQIKDIATSEGMKDLRRSALEKVIAGVTSLEEAIQNTLAN